MKECEECGKPLGIFEGYQHPTLGKKHLLCNPCFDQVSESVARWRNFILSNSFKNGSPKKDFNLNWKNFTPSFSQRRNVIENVCAEPGILIQKWEKR